jgi:hypothetical protein
MMGKKNKVGMMMAVMMGKKPAKSAMTKMATPKKVSMSKVKTYPQKMK